MASAGEDILEFGISEEEKNVIKKYFSFGGLENYENLCKWLYVIPFSQKNIK